MPAGEESAREASMNDGNPSKYRALIVSDGKAEQNDTLAFEFAAHLLSSPRDLA